MTGQIPLPPSGLSPLIGPHEGRELELMLAGKKKLAMWTDAVQVFEEKPWWIPEEAFAPHVAAGRIIRHTHDRPSDYYSKNGIVRTLGYTLPGEEWRFAAAMFLREEVADHTIFYVETDADDIVIGRLLGYSLEEIRAFLQKGAKTKAQRLENIKKRQARQI